MELQRPPATASCVTQEGAAGVRGTAEKADTNNQQSLLLQERSDCRGLYNSGAHHILGLHSSDSTAAAQHSTRGMT